ncbi:MAG: ANTAR domain-containing protein [Eubacterium sp.]|nr:ANTAR domain-containing protein [Eubacterium sp.]
MKSALIVSKSEKTLSSLAVLLGRQGYKEVHKTTDSAKASDFLDLMELGVCIVDIAPEDEDLRSLAMDGAADSPGCQFVVLVREEDEQEFARDMESRGIIIVSRPMNRQVFLTVLKMVDAVRIRMSHISSENDQLHKKIDDIRLINRAKMTIMTYLNMSEPDAHRYIEKQAMDLRITRRKVAENILKTYQN